MFCNNCGKEVADNAYVCTGCGCLVNEEYKSLKKKKNIKGKIATILLISSFGFFCCHLFWEYFILFGNGPMVQIFMWICSFIALSVAIPAFILGLKQKEQLSLKILTILNLMLTFSVGASYFCNIILRFILHLF